VRPRSRARVGRAADGEPRTKPVAPALFAQSPPRVRFADVRGIVFPLEFETRGGVLPLADVVRLLFLLRVQILTVTEERCSGDTVRVRLRVCEFHGAPLGRTRREVILAELNRRVVPMGEGSSAA
jgi:hypothetical protein